MSSPTPAETSAGVAVGLHRRIPMRIRRPPAIHKKPQSPQAHVSQAMHCSSCLAASHTPRIPIQAISSYNHNLTMRPPRPAAGLRKSSANSVSSNSLRRRGGHGYGIASRCDDGVVATTGGPMPVIVEPESPMIVRPEGRPWNRGPPGGGQLRGSICVSFPGACRGLASGLRWRFCVFLPSAAQGGSVGIRIAYPACFGLFPTF